MASASGPDIGGCSECGSARVASADGCGSIAAAVQERVSCSTYHTSKRSTVWSIVRRAAELYPSVRMPPPIRVMTVDDHPLYRDGIAALLALHPDLALVAEAG